MDVKLFIWSNIKQRKIDLQILVGNGMFEVSKIAQRIVKTNQGIIGTVDKEIGVMGVSDRSKKIA